MPLCRRLVAMLALPRPESDPRADTVGYVVDKVTLVLDLTL
jgi:hypothetical protein